MEAEMKQMRVKEEGMKQKMCNKGRILMLKLTL